MTKINRLFSLLKNKDVRSFALYACGHQKAILNRKAIESLPTYLSQEDFVKTEKIKTDYCIKKLNFPTDKLTEKLSISPDKNSAKPQGSASISNFFAGKTIIHLAGSDDEIDINNTDWLKTYGDPEDVAAFHRFFWLYRLIWENRIENDSQINNKIKAIIYSWIDTVESKDKSEVHSEVWQTYSVVERLISWLTVLGLTELTADYDKKIISSIIRQLDHIQNNFEYYGEKFTSNHFCNDGRGLYICGTVLGIDEFSDLGKKIIQNMLPKILPDDIFLREGSTHYQLLITKWMADCYWIATECGDTEFADRIRAKLPNLAAGCQYFMVKSESGFQYPLMGDISPDLTPEWLLDTYFNKGNDISRLASKCQNKADGSNDWKRSDSESFTVLSHVNNSLYPNNLTGHFHHDSGSIAAFYKGIPLLIDCGRVNYVPSDAGLWMKSYHGHSICCIDGYDPELDMRTFYSDDFLKSYAGKAPTISKTKNAISTLVFAGKRIKGIDSHKRTIELANDAMTIIDFIDGRGSHEATLLFHVDACWQATAKEDKIELSNGKQQLVIKTDKCQLRICENNESKSFYGLRSREYGALEQCTSIIGIVKFDAPCTITTLIERL